MPQATDYSVPPWIRGGNPLQAVEAGASLGQRIAESNQRAAFEFAQMQAQQSEFQQRMAMQQQQLEQQQAFQQQQFQADQTIQEQKQMRKDQQLAIENAYKQGQLGLKQQQLDLANKAATEQFQSQVQFQKDLTEGTNQRVAQGMDLEQARREAFQDALFKNPFSKVPPTALRSMSESLSGGAPKWGTSPGGAEYVTESAGGGRQIVKFPPRPSAPPEEAARKAEAADITAQIREEQKLLLAEPDKDKQLAIQEKLLNLAQRRRKLLSPKPVAAKVAPTTTETSPSRGPLPLPKSEKDLEKDEIYQTSRGPAKWDGSQFISATPPASPEHPNEE